MKFLSICVSVVLLLGSLCVLPAAAEKTAVQTVVLSSEKNGETYTHAATVNGKAVNIYDYTWHADPSTVHDAVKPPSVVVTVIVAVPALRATILPLKSTDATEGSEEDQATPLSAAFAGRTFSISVSAPPTTSVVDDLLSSTPVTAISSS